MSDSLPLRGPVGLEALHITQTRNVYWNLTPAELYEHAIRNGEAVLTRDMALRVLTGAFTGRSPKDKFVVEDDITRNTIDWGQVNQPTQQGIFDRLHDRMVGYLAGQHLYVQDVFVGSDPDHRMPVRVVSEAAYHALFTRNMFIRPTKKEIREFRPEFTVLAAPTFNANPERDGTRTSTFILCSFTRKLILIGGTLYSGEVKKGIFGVMNFLLPKKGVMPMHCSANIDQEGRTSVFFGLSGTGKTTLSADPQMTLIGDDEHGWSDNGVFNFEGGCYAKTVDLTPESEPMIYATTKMPETILENVILDDDRTPVFSDTSLTENTRCSYPITHIPNASRDGRGGHPENILFLTADAFGVMPPISRLTPEQAMYHFISGYTAKVAGTERGVTEPTATFSACFGAPFMPLHPSVYAELLAERIRKHGSTVWLVNTGWTGGPHGVGSRMKLTHTRRMLSEAIAGNLNEATFQQDPVFGLWIPDRVDGVPSELLFPRNTWADKNAYDAKAKDLARMFRDNFKKFEYGTSNDVIQAGPVLTS